MIAALDAHYDEAARAGSGAAVVFRHWDDAVPAAEYSATCSPIEPYEPGEFYKRELPCLLAVLAKVREPLEVVVVDGYVTLGSRPGLGQRLWEALGGKTAVVGVAKSRFHSAAATEVLRGRSRTPLLVTAAGIGPAEAAAAIARMAGEFRLPLLLKRADQLARCG